MYLSPRFHIYFRISLLIYATEKIYEAPRKKLILFLESSKMSPKSSDSPTKTGLSTGWTRYLMFPIDTLPHEEVWLSPGLNNLKNFYFNSLPS